VQNVVLQSKPGVIEDLTGNFIEEMQSDNKQLLEEIEGKDLKR